MIEDRAMTAAVLEDLRVVMGLGPDADVLEEALGALGFAQPGEIDAVDGMNVLLELERRRAAGELVRIYDPGHGLLYLPPGFESDPELDSDDMVEAASQALDAAEAKVTGHAPANDQ